MEIYSKSAEVHRNEYWDTVSDVSKVEEYLVSPPDQEVFLTASMAFLKKRLEDKLDEKLNNKKNKKKSVSYTNTRSYSRLLVFEFDSGVGSERCFVRVQNNEKYEELLKRECFLNSREKLSLDQILPKAKKPKSESKSFIKRFTSSSLKFNITREANTETEPKRSISFFTIFKRTTPNPSQCNLSCVSTTSIDLKLLPPTPSQNSMLSGFIKPQRTESCCSCASIRTYRSCNRTESAVLKPMILGPDEVEILQLIPSSPSQCSRATSPRRRKSRDFQQEYCAPSDHGDSIIGTHVSNYSSSVRVCSSKLSVCMEDEEEDEEMEEGEHEADKESVLEVSTYRSCNLTDEVKSNFSTESLDIVMRRLKQYFEYNTPGVEKQKSRIGFC